MTPLIFMTKNDKYINYHIVKCFTEDSSETLRMK